MTVKGSDIKKGDIFQKSGYTIEVLEIVSESEKTITVKTVSKTKSGHSQMDTVSIRKTTNLNKIN
jgi:hypothetical protein